MIAKSSKSIETAIDKISAELTVVGLSASESRKMHAKV